MVGAQLMGWGMPLTPVMLLLINVLGDGIPGLRLAYERSDERVMSRKPVGREESFLGDGLMRVILQQTVAFSVVGLAAYYLGTFVQLAGTVAPSHIVGQTMAFLVVAFTCIVHIFTVRGRKSMFKVTLSYNMPLLYSAIGMLALFAGMVLIQPVQFLFGLTTISAVQWLIVIGLTVVPSIVAELVKYFDNRIESDAYRRRVVRHIHKEAV